MTSFSANNRQVQNQIGFYESKSEISEGIAWLKKVFSPVTIEYLTQYTYTDNGVTQAKVAEICKQRGVSTSTYSETIKPEIETLLGEPIIEIKKTQKLDHSRSKKVQGSSFKILIPLRKIKYLVKKFLKQKHDQEIAELQAFRAAMSTIPGDEIEKDIETDIESDAQDPRQDSAEDDFSNGQNKSFRENLLEKDLKTLIKDDQNFKISFPKIGIKKEIKKYMDSFPLFRDFSNWSQAKKYEVARTLQLAIVKHPADLQEPKIQYMIKDAIAAFSEKYLKKPQDEFLRLFYTYVSNALKNTQEDQSESNEDQSEDDQEYFSPLFKKNIEKKVPQERSRCQSIDEYRKANREKIQDLDDQGVY